MKSLTENQDRYLFTGLFLCFSVVLFYVSVIAYTGQADLVSWMNHESDIYDEAIDRVATLDFPLNETEDIRARTAHLYTLQMIFVLSLALSALFIFGVVGGIVYIINAVLYWFGMTPLQRIKRLEKRHKELKPWA